MKKETLSLLLKSVLPPWIGATIYAAIYKLDFLMFFAGYMLIVMPTWFVLSNIKFILKANWIQSIAICLFFCFTIIISGASSMELGILFKNTGEVSVGAFAEACQAVFMLALPSNVIMTVVVAIAKVLYEICKKRNAK